MSLTMRDAQIKINSFIAEVKYYPIQIDLDKNIFRFYQEYINHPQFFREYQNLYLVEIPLSIDKIFELKHSNVIEFQDLAEELNNQSLEIYLEILNAFKLYVILQEKLKQKIVLNEYWSDMYEKLNQFFKSLRKFPEEVDLRVNKREILDEVESNRGNFMDVIPYFLMIILIVFCLYLMIYKTGIWASIAQGAIFCIMFFMSRSMLKKAKEHQTNEIHL